jgi:hypothetical protein
MSFLFYVQHHSATKPPPSSKQYSSSTQYSQYSTLNYIIACFFQFFILFLKTVFDCRIAADSSWGGCVAVLIVKHKIFIKNYTSIITVRYIVPYNRTLS